MDPTARSGGAAPQPGRRRAPLLRADPLAEGLARELDAWLESARARHLPPLTPRELHAGVRGLSGRYVQGRGEGLSRRVFDGAGKRAAFALYYAPLHFLTAWHAAAAAFPEGLQALERIHDLGCGSAPLAAALARAAPRPPALEGTDPSSFALAEARHTLAAFGLHGRLRRGRLPGAAPRGGPGELWALGWVVNELDDAERDGLLERLDAALARGARLLLLEPLAGSVSPWWDAWRRALAERGVVADELRVRAPLPVRLAEIDRATGLRHAELGARLLHGPHP